MNARGVVVAMVLAATLAAVEARAATWASTGPGPASISGFGLDPAQPNVLYAATAGGAVFRSADGGATWQRTAPTGDFRILGMAVRGSLVLAASDAGSNGGVGGVYRSLDGGVSWNFAGPAAGIANGIVRPLGIDPTNPSILLAGTNGGLFRSVDGGGSWYPVTVPTGTQIAGILFDPANDGVVYVATSNQGVSRSVDRGAVFTAFNTGFTASLDGGLFLDGSTLYGAGFYGAVRTPTAAAAWADVSTGLPPDTFIGGIGVSGTRILAATGTAWYASPTGLISWSTAPAPPFAAHRLLVDASLPARVYAYGAGLARSTNSGLSWERLDAGIPGLGASLVAATAPGSVLVGTNDRGMLRSDDLGTSFAASSDGFTATVVDQMVVDPVDPANVLAASSPALFGSTDGGRTWTPRTFGSSFYVGVLAYAPSDPRIVYGATFSGAIGFAKRSVDGGTSWDFIQPPTTFNFPSAIVVDPTDADVAYLATDIQLYATTSGGMPWTVVGAGLPEGTARCLAIDPANPTTLYAAVGASVWRSTDRAVSWLPLSALPPGATVTALLVDPRRPQRVWAATLEGVFRSTDAGATWQSFSDGLPNRFVRSLSLDRGEAALYAATDGGVAVSRFVAGLRLTPAVGSSAVAPGGQTTLTVVVANDGPDDATQVGVTVAPTLDVAVAGGSVSEGTCTPSPTAGCQLARLDAGQQATLTFDLQAGTTTGAATLALAATATQDVGGAATATASLRVVDGPFLANAVIPVVKRKALVPITCASTTRKTCRGSIRLAPTETDARPRVLGKARFSVGRGLTATRKVRVKSVRLAPGEQRPADLTLRAAGASDVSRVTLQGQ